MRQRVTVLVLVGVQRAWVGQGVSGESRRMRLLGATLRVACVGGARVGRARVADDAVGDLGAPRVGRGWRKFPDVIACRCIF